MLQIKRLSSFADLKKFDNTSVPFFQIQPYLQIFAKHFCRLEDTILLRAYEKENLIGYGAFEKISNKIIFLGMRHVLNNQELTDYGDIFVETRHGASNGERRKNDQDMNSENLSTEVWSAIIDWFVKNGYKNAEFDYVREDSLTYKFFSSNKNIRVNQLSISVNQNQQGIAPYILLPASWEIYINQLEYKKRRELRRKMNRLDKEMSGKYLYQCIDASIQDEAKLKEYFAEFIRLVKLSENAKNSFMSKEMGKFFWDLISVGNGRDRSQGASHDLPLQKNAWQPVLNFLQIDGKNAAVILTFENGTESLAYNSGYNPQFNYYSAGFLCHAFKIRDLISRGFKKYDFLRGSERYKFDLGANNLNLYKINIEVN